MTKKKFTEANIVPHLPLGGTAWLFWTYDYISITFTVYLHFENISKAYNSIKWQRSLANPRFCRKNSKNCKHGQLATCFVWRRQRVAESEGDAKSGEWGCESGIGVYPTRVGAIAVVRHDDDCPIRGQACEIRLGGKVAVGGIAEERLCRIWKVGLWWQKCVISEGKNVTFRWKGCIIRPSIVSRTELGLFSGFVRITVDSAVCSLLFFLTGRLCKSLKIVQNHLHRPETTPNE